MDLRHFTSDGDRIYKLVRARALKSGVKHFSSHDFRRTFCSDLLEDGEDVFTVQELAGHVSPVTTSKYDRFLLLLIGLSSFQKSLTLLLSMGRLTIFDDRLRPTTRTR